MKGLSLLLPMPLFSFLHPSLPSFLVSLPLSLRTGRELQKMEGGEKKNEQIQRRLDPRWG